MFLVLLQELVSILVFILLDFSADSILHRSFKEPQTANWWAIQSPRAFSVFPSHVFAPDRTGSPQP